MLQFQWFQWHRGQVSRTTAQDAAAEIGIIKPYNRTTVKAIAPGTAGTKEVTEDVNKTKSKNKCMYTAVQQ